MKVTDAKMIFKRLYIYFHDENAFGLKVSLVPIAKLKGSNLNSCTIHLIHAQADLITSNTPWQKEKVFFFLYTITTFIRSSTSSLTSAPFLAEFL